MEEGACMERGACMAGERHGRGAYMVGGMPGGGMHGRGQDRHDRSGLRGRGHSWWERA